MNYSEPLFSQFAVFLKALGCGVILGVLYDVFVFFRMLAGDKKSIYVFFDLFFSVSAAFISFFFMVIFNSGQVRLNLMISSFIGGVCFHFAFGRYVLISVEKFIIKVRKAFKIILSPLVKFYSIGSTFFVSQLKRISERRNKEKNIEKKSKKITNIRDKHLKNKKKSV